MDNFKGKYLRVLTPKTTNGIIPKLIDGEQQYKETHLPYSSLPLMQAQNSKLLASNASHLQHKLEIIGDTGPEDTAQTIAARPFRPQRFPRSNPQPGMGRPAGAKNTIGKSTKPPKQTTVSNPPPPPVVTSTSDTENNTEL